MKDILIIAHFTQIPGEAGNSRFNYIAEKIDKDKAAVEIVTTRFSHRTKMPRNIREEQLKRIDYKLTMLREPGYKKNVTLKRFYSHFVMGRNLKKYLENRKKPDVIYCAVPSLDVAKVAALYANKNSIEFIIDIQDLWPEAFKMVFNIPIISNGIFYPMKRKADFIYSTADNIVAVSKTYIERATRVNKKYNKAQSVYLGTDLANFDRLAEENKFTNKPKNEIWLAYIGTLGHSYDICSVIDALNILEDEGLSNIKFIVMGEGPLREKFENYAKDQGVNVEFTGRLDYSKMVGILKSCDIAVNPIKAGSAGSIINKVADYAAAGLPVINTQESIEYKQLIEQYESGFNCNNNDPYDIAEKMFILLDKETRIKKGLNSRRMAIEFFDRGLTYKYIYDLLL